MSKVIEVDKLEVVYRTPFARRRVQAVKDATFAVEAGEVFGFLGHNGAGKTTTMRVLMGLMRATSGSCKIFGHDIPSREARRRLGFLPESPYFYDYLSVAELCDLAGRLFGMDAAARKRRADELIELVGLSHARSMPVRKYSKGMLQRAGIAQALVNDPELVVFDEPMSGLDPVGRKEVRDIMLGLRDQGKTVFFSTHILPDVEMIADRVAIISRGVVENVGTLSEVVAKQVTAIDIAFRASGELGADAVASLEAQCQQVRNVGDEVFATVAPDVDLDELIASARGLGLRVQSVSPHHETLEDVFLRSAVRS